THGIHQSTRLPHAPDASSNDFTPVNAPYDKNIQDDSNSESESENQSGGESKDLIEEEEWENSSMLDTESEHANNQTTITCPADSGAHAPSRPSTVHPETSTMISLDPLDSWPHSPLTPTPSGSHYCTRSTRLLATSSNSDSSFTSCSGTKNKSATAQCRELENELTALKWQLELTAAQRDSTEVHVVFAMCENAVLHQQAN
ncbi:hypothetical protein C0993_003159, partial [Termitomyces sp. T159_Od127]